MWSCLRTSPSLCRACAGGILFRDPLSICRPHARRMYRCNRRDGLLTRLAVACVPSNTSAYLLCIAFSKTRYSTVALSYWTFWFCESLFRGQIPTDSSRVGRGHHTHFGSLAKFDSCLASRRRTPPRFPFLSNSANDSSTPNNFLSPSSHHATSPPTEPIFKKTIHTFSIHVELQVKICIMYACIVSR